MVIEEPVEDVQLVGTEVAPTSKGVPREEIEVVPIGERAPKGGGECDAEAK